jgi:hypothetical protein
MRIRGIRHNFGNNAHNRKKSDFSTRTVTQDYCELYTVRLCTNQYYGRSPAFLWSASKKIQDSNCQSLYHSPSLRIEFQYQFKPRVWSMLLTRFFSVSSIPIDNTILN